MVRYVVLLSYLEKGIAAVKASPDRSEVFRQAAAKMGATVDLLYWTQGSYDGLLVLSAPDDTTAGAVILNLAQGGNVRTTTMRAYDAGEFRDIVARMG